MMHEEHEEEGIIEHEDLMDDEIIDSAIKSEGYSTYRELLDEYVRLSMSRAILNKKSSTTLFHCLIGEAMKLRGIEIKHVGELDTRVSSLIFQPTRTGKQIVLDFLCQMASMVKPYYEGKVQSLLAVQELQFTDAALVGRIDDDTVKRNRIKGALDPGAPGWRNPITLGDFGLYNMVTFPEARTMFKEGPYNKDLLDLLQMVTDYNGHIRKKTAIGIPLEYKCKSTVIGTSYVLEEFREIVTKQGIFQRFYIMHDPFPRRDLVSKAMHYSGTVTEEELERVGEDLKIKIIPSKLPDHIKEEIGHEIVDYDEIPERMEKLANRITEIVNSYPEDYIFYKDEEAADRFNYYEEQRQRIIDAHFIGEQADLLAGFTTSITLMHYKIAAIAAMLNGHRVITKEDVDASYRPTMGWYYSAIINDVLSKVAGANETKIRKTIINILKGVKTKGLNRMDLIDKLDDTFPFERKLIGKIIKDMMESNMITQDEGVIKIVKR
jgi:hypothetical protein